MRFLICLLVALVGLSSTSTADEKSNIEKFEKLVVKIRKSADDTREKIKSVISKTGQVGGGVTISQSSKLDMLGKYGRYRVFNKNGDVWIFAANKSYAFHLVKDDKPSKKWRLQQISERKKNKAKYELLWDVKNFYNVDSQIGYEGGRALLDLWDRKQLRITSFKENKKDKSVSVEFEPSPIAVIELTEWEVAKKSVESFGAPKTIEELRRRQEAIGKRPTELISVKSKIDLSKGAFVTYFEMKTQQSTGVQKSVVKASEIQRYKECYFASRWSREIEFDEKKTVASIQVISVGKNSKIKPEELKLTFYGLDEPK